ncbi:hypothetical protein TIFTF001_033867 [Ficus carica]|uniref:Uncharacterized protein n=1 Tax=Ficus carica TaxID=3494 RepID=A0AA88E665_FICCA|nr:hypothetical protein TIFTF001_033867 [Ficus carica]
MARPNLKRKKVYELLQYPCTRVMPLDNVERRDDQVLEGQIGVPRGQQVKTAQHAVIGPSSIKRGGPPTERDPSFSLNSHAVTLPKQKQHLQFGTHRGALGHLTSETRTATMAAEHEHQDELPQGSPVDH